VYVALLTADYDGILPPLSLKSRSFLLSLSPPEPTLYATPSHLEPGSEGIKKPVVFELAARAALAKIESWRLDLVGPDGRLLGSYEGSWPAVGAPEPISWDGRSGSGAAVEAGKRYSAILSVRDIYGHAGSSQAGLVVAELPYDPERSSVQPWTNGFSPNGDKIMDSMDFSLSFGQRAAIRSWRLDIARAENGVVRSFQGSAPNLPASLSWDGTTSQGTIAPEGRYIATLNIDYGSTFSPAAARSPSFVLDVTPPSLRLFTSPALFAPDLPATLSGGPAATLSVRLDAASGLARITDWSLEILDPGSHVFAHFGGAWPAAAITWDGVGADGSLVESAETYRLVASVRDEFGNSSQAQGRVDTDILVIKEGNRYRVDVASILFKGYTDDYEDLPPEQVAQNRQTLDRLAAKFARFPDYKIRLVGHAVMINWDDPNLGKPEQEDILIPLSKARAAAIAKALSARGIAESRLIVEGVGALKPLVPDSDLVNRWKNRRVEFYLEK
jgi:outer membrane protein OmpA-like peptidoglycan-associated protein